MNNRTVERLKGVAWTPIVGINELHKGNVFRMFEPDGEPVVSNEGEIIFHATSEPYWSDIHNDWSIDIGNPLH